MFFGNQTIYALDYDPRLYSLAIGDLNNDNQSDIIIARSGTDQIDILSKVC